MLFLCNTLLINKIEIRINTLKGIINKIDSTILAISKTNEENKEN